MKKGLTVPERSGAASTLIWDPKLDLKKLNANLSPTLGRCDYCAVYLYNMPCLQWVVIIKANCILRRAY